MSRTGSIGRADLDCRMPEHRVGKDSSGEASEDLHRNVRDRINPGPTTENAVEERDNGIQVRAADRREYQGDDSYPKRRCDRVLGELESRMSWREGLRRDAGADDDRGKK